MIKIIKIILIMVFAYSSSSLSAYSLKNDSLRFQELENQGELPSRKIKDVVQDSLGYIWFATEYGLVRYDSRKFKIYDVNDEDNYIVNNFVNTLSAGENGEVLVGTESGLSVIRKYGVNLHFNDLGFVNDILYNSTDKKYYVVSNKGVYIFDGEKVKQKNEFLNTTLIKVFSKENEIYYLTNKGVYSDKKNDYIFNIQDEIIDVFVKNENLYFLSTKSLYKSDFVNYESVFYSPENETFKSSGDYSDDEIYLSTFDGSFIIYNINNRKFVKHKIFNSAISKVFTDTSGIKWFVGSDGIKYVSYLKKASFFYPFDKAKNYEFHKKNLIVKEKSRFNIGQNKDYISDKNYLWDSTKDENGLWLLYDNKIEYRNNIHKSSLIFDMDEKGISKSDLYNIIKNDSESVWISGYVGVGVFLLTKKGEIVKRYLYEKNLEFNKNKHYILSMIKKDNILYLGTTNGLIVINTNDDTVNYFYINNKESNARVNSIDLDDKGNLWLATEGFGLFKYFQGELVKIKTKYPENRFLNLIYKESKIFLTNKNSLFVYNIESNNFSNYKTLLNDLNLNFYPNRAKKYNDSIFISSREGLIEIDTNSLYNNSFNTNIKIDYVKSDGNLEKESNIYKYGSDLTFKFDSLDYNSTEKYFRYKLEGVNEDWVYTDINKITYNNLLSGRYKFIVNGTNSDGLWSNEPVIYEFEVENPWWFYALIIISTITLLIFIIYLVSRQKQLKKLYYRANYDEMTGVANRFKFKKNLDELLKLSDSENKIAVLFLSINEFKIINDSLGHHVGDALIKKLSSKIVNFFGDSGFVARFGGDEFSIILYNYNNIDYLKNVLNGLSQITNDEYKINDNLIRLHCSIGASIYNEELDTETMISNADIAMYKSKKSDLNKYVIFENTMQDQFVERAEIKNDLHKVIDNDELKLLFQPKVSPTNGEIVGFEALVRWIHPKKGMVRPDIFIQESESNGTIIPIGRWVISKTIEMASHLYHNDLLVENVSFNFSPMQIHDENLYEFIEDEIKRFNLPPEKLEMEITESLFLTDFSETLNLLNKLRNLGVSIGLDDFGTGYSSLNYLLKIPIDTLKLDRAFIQDVHISKNRNLVKHMFNMAKDFGFKVVVEGIEKENQIEILKEMGDFSYQGYYFSPPVDEKVVNEMFKVKS